MMRSLLPCVLALVTACGPREPTPQNTDQPPAGTPTRPMPDTGAAGAAGRDVCDVETNEVWADACRRGVTFRAIGQEPGWLLEIDGARGMLLALDYGETRIEATLPAPQRQGQQLTYSVRTDAGAVSIAITESPCEDIMSGEAFPTTVSVTVDGRQHDGCGRPMGMS